MFKLVRNAFEELTQIANRPLIPTSHVRFPSNLPHFTDAATAEDVSVWPPIITTARSTT
jgi:hypothetical protein